MSGRENTTTPQAERSFPDPYEVETPAGAEGWKDLYAYHNLFIDGRRDEDGAKTSSTSGLMGFMSTVTKGATS
jgi:pyruvate,water dikinase